MTFIKRLRLGYNDENKCYSMLFIGPSGVGKTMLASFISNSLSKSVIKLDMGEYTSPNSVNKFIGSPPGYIGYDEPTSILETIKSKPYSYIIVDKVEKASKEILDLFLQILSMGEVKDSKNNTVRFDNVSIIFETNIGFLNGIGFSTTKNNLSKLKEELPDSFINKIDKIITFNHLDKDIIKKIVIDKINMLKEKYNKKSISIKIGKNVIDDIIDLSNYNEFGASKIDRIIKEKLENIIIDNILIGNKIILINSIKVNI